MPIATVFVRSSTVTSTWKTPPSPSVSSETQRSPTSIGHHRLVMSTVKSAGSRCTFSSPWGRADDGVLAFPEAPPPHAVSVSAPTAATVSARARSARALIGVLHVRGAPDDLEVLVELHVDLVTVVERD